MQLKIEKGLDALKEERLVELRDEYQTVCTGVDPATGQQIYVDCLVGTETYRMNAGRNASETFDSGIRLSEQNGETETIVVDFYDQVHQGVPLADAREINRQQAVDARTHYIEKQTLKGMILMAATVAELRAIPIQFTTQVFTSV